MLYSPLHVSVICDISVLGAAMGISVVHADYYTIKYYFYCLKTLSILYISWHKI